MTRQSQKSMRRLEEHYAAMAEGKLLKLATEFGDLTETAQHVLRCEMNKRGLELPQSAPTNDIAEGLGANDKAAEKITLVLLITLHDAVTARRVCSLLAEASIGFDIKDRTIRMPRIKLPIDSPVLILDIYVGDSDCARATAILREGAGLFPVQDVGLASTSADECDRILPIGYFAMRADAEVAAGILDNAQILHRITMSHDRSAAGSNNAYILEVLESDMLRAGDAISEPRYLFP